MKFDQQPMVGWYDVKQLAATAFKTLLSLVFGNYADKRELQAFAEQDVFDFSDSQKDDLWIDYISDLGDGFNPTYTLAHLMAKEQIQVGQNQLQRGNILIMGGDEVYPTPEKIEYQNRLQGPYNAAFPWKDEDKNRPKLFAIPGNHDWYDGLTNFTRLFCQNRSLGNWLTQQKRSYFALKLPYNFWIIGIDIQLKGDIDAPQKAYFKKIAKESFKQGDQIILCTAEPVWTYASLSDNHEAYDRLDYFIDHILKGKHEKSYRDKNKGIHIAAILSGDLHHYSRYELQLNDSQKSTQLITAGGGGAFMHPTHMLKDEITTKKGEKASLEGIFPSKKASKKLMWKNLAFPLINWSMCLFLGLFHLLTIWIIQSSTLHAPQGSFLQSISQIDIMFTNINKYIDLIFHDIIHIPMALILNLILFFGIFLFTDTSTGKKKLNYSLGFPHAILQLSNFYFCVWLFSRWNFQNLESVSHSFKQIFLFSIELVLLGGILSGLIFGIYLLCSTLIFGSHPTEASSSFKHEGYKNFLRIHLSKDKLIIYPIGLKNVVSNWKNVNTDDVDKPKFKDSPILTELIENEPIEIKYTS